MEVVSCGVVDGGLPVYEVVVDFGGGKVRVVNHDGHGDVFGRELWESPLLQLSANGQQTSCARCWKLTRLITWS